MDYVYEAHKVIYEHCESIMTSGAPIFKRNDDMYEFTVKGCAFVLTENFLQGKYTPLQYNAIRNELSAILWGAFGHHVEKERNDEIIKLYSI